MIYGSSRRMLGMHGFMNEIKYAVFTNKYLVIGEKSIYF